MMICGGICYFFFASLSFLRIFYLRLDDLKTAYTTKRIRTAKAMVERLKSYFCYSCIYNIRTE